MAKKDTDKLSNREERQKEKKQLDTEKAKSWLREWVDAIVFAFIAASILRTFIFGSYKIPTSSMERNLLVNDHLIVSNFTYGPRTPMSICVPFTDWCVPGVKLPWFRIPGYKDVEHDDIIVFNYPVEVKPISQKTYYIKRAVGLPGDSVEVIDKLVYRNGEIEGDHEGLQRFYEVYTKGNARLSPMKVSSVNSELMGVLPNTNIYVLNATNEAAEQIASWVEVDSMALYTTSRDVIKPGYRNQNFSFSLGFNNNDNMKKFEVPYEGLEVELTSENWHIYQDIIERYERNTVERRGDQFTINGEETNTYTIQQNYYFLMGDNRDNSEDSRSWGFVPHDHIVGKAAFVWWSYENVFLLPRFDRLFYLID